jgi:hypothetical protein
MKILNLKNVAAACGAGLLLFTLPASAGTLAPIHFGRQAAKFDDLPNQYNMYLYGGLYWYNFYTLDPSTLFARSGYLAGLKSPNNVIHNSPFTGVSPSIASLGQAPIAPNYSAIGNAGYIFILNSAYLTSAWNDNLQVTVQGYYHGRWVYKHTYTLSAVKPTLVTFPPQLVEYVIFTTSGGTPHAGYAGAGTQFAMDNVTYTVLPITTYLF